MKTRLQIRLAAVRTSRSIGDLVVNRDWVQAQILAGIARSAALSAALVFKGGSALQKVFFGASYRFSEDLDFTGLPSTPRRAALQAALHAVCNDVERYAADRTGERFSLTCTRYEEKLPHPTQEVFKFAFVMPWQRQSSGHVKLEITFDEPIVLPTELRPLLVTYDDADANIVSYCVEEVILEKLRAAPQTLANREKRIAGGRGNWLRARSRDFYDLSQIIDSSLMVSWPRVRESLAEKCRVRNVAIASIADIFAPEIIEEVKRQWKAQLGDFVPVPLPDVDELLTRLEPALAEYLGWK